MYTIGGPSGAKAYTPLGAGPVGCAIVGAGAGYALLFYDAARATLAMAPVAGSRFEPQPGGKGLYVTFSPLPQAPATETSTYSIAAASPAAAVELLRNLAATAAHIALHGAAGGSGSGPFVVDSPMAAAGAAAAGSGSSATGAAQGDALTVRFSVLSATLTPSARPTDALKAPPVCRDLVRRVVVAGGGQGGGFRACCKRQSAATDAWC